MGTPLLSALGLLNSINLGRRAVNAQQNALQIVGRNIANVNTPGYTRQKVTIGVPDGHVGVVSGERGSRVERVRDELVERLFLQERQQFASIEKRAAILSEVETAVAEPSDTALNAQIERFFGAWTALANTPESDAAKNVVLERGKTLAATFLEMTRRLETIQQQNIADAQEIERQINAKLEQIREFNEQISNAFNSGSEFLELQDRQDQIIRELSDLISVRVVEGSSGMRTVQTAGLALVEGRVAGRVELRTSLDKRMSVVANLDGNRFDVQLRGGRLHGLIVGQNEMTSTILKDLHRVGRVLVDEVNRLHPNFFRSLTKPDERQRAGAFMEVLAKKPVDIKPGGASPNSGANQTALDVADLRSTKVEMRDLQDVEEAKLPEEKQVVTSFYQELIGAIGARAAETNQQRDTAQLLVQQIEQRREGISGVSLDEEATDLLIFQRAFQAAARYIQVIDDLVETLVNRG